MREKTVRDVRREEIIAAARDLFSRKGYHGTSVPDIARAAGISTGLIYYIFPNKENILLACCEMAAVIHLDLFNQTTDIADPLQRFDYIVRELYKSLDRGSKWVIIIYRDSSILTRETRQQVMALIKHVDNRFLELFEEGQRTGYFARDIPKLPLLASNVLNLGHMWALQKTWRFGPETDLETYTSAQLDYFHARLLPKAGSQEQTDTDGQAGAIALP